MKIFRAEQLRAWDAATIASEPISSIDLMERAAMACTRWLLEHFGGEFHFYVFCGSGNNGGDGLAIARQLVDYGREVSVFILEPASGGSPDFLANLKRLQAISGAIELVGEDYVPQLTGKVLIIDALFGTGLNKPISGTAAKLVRALNATAATRIAIDMPSGLYADRPSSGNDIFEAAHTLTFGAPKLGLLLQENGPYTGQLHVLDIGLDRAFGQAAETNYHFVDTAVARLRYRPRAPFAHKGTYGHALLAVGAYGKMGAAVIAATAFLRGGAGLLTCHVPRCGVAILQTALPEAMVIPDREEEWLANLPPSLETYRAIGIGPGIGKGEKTAGLLESYLQKSVCPLVLDADALNIIASNPGLLILIPKGSILTPHPKEFERLFGVHANDFDRISTALSEAEKLGCVVLLKGHHTFIAATGGHGYFNSTGNAGMAKGGSGDALTGLLTALLASGYPAEDAAILGVWLHGCAGDLAAKEYGMESMLPTDLLLQLGEAFKKLYD